MLGLQASLSTVRVYGRSHPPTSHRTARLNPGRALRWPTVAAGLGCLAGCLGDPVGPGGTLALRRLSPVDSVLVGAPGRPLPNTIIFQAVDGEGRPVPAASVGWIVAGANARVDQAAAVTDVRGQFSVVWVLGTKASDQQGLTAQVATGNHKASITVPAVAKPVEVSSIAFDTHDTTQVKLGVPVRMTAQATDPFGNKFVPSQVRFTSLDTSLCSVDSLGFVQARKRGFSRVAVSAASVADTAWVHPTQVVQAIIAAPDTVKFHSLGQTATVAVNLVDDQGLAVKDSTPADSVAVDSVARVQAGSTYAIRSVSNGATPVVLRAGIVAQTIQVVVMQKIATVKLSASHSSFNALGDTVQLSALAADSMGTSVSTPVLNYSVGDTSVASVGATGVLISKRNGSTRVYVRALSGVSDSLPIVVSQQVVRVVAKRDTILLNALKAALPIQVTALDRLGSPVASATLSYSSAAPAIASVDASGNVQALANGTALVSAAAAGDSTFILVSVAQRPVRLAVSPDTVRFVALGDTSSIAAVAMDSLGSVIPGGASLALVDSSIVTRVDSMTVRARSNGVTTATAAAAGVTGQVVFVVNQVPTTLQVGVSFPNAVLTLSVGAPLPVLCQAFDKNGFLIARDPAFVGSLRGTVNGTRCGDAQIQRSGYDTLFFALGPTRARVGVIVATRPDSVTVLAAAQPMTTVQRDSFVGEDLANPLIVALRPQIADILAAYGNPTTNIARARALRDWVARTAVHPYAGLHPDSSTSNLSVLPPGTSWADANAASTSKIDDDTQYWGSVGMNGYLMLDRLLGTLDPNTGIRADDGMMVHAQGARYVIRDVQAYRYVVCTFQAVILNTLWAAAGLHGMFARTIDHDPAAVFIPELGHWVYEDPTYNEEYFLDGGGDPLSPADLLSISSMGQASRLQARKSAGPVLDSQTYVPWATYINQGHAGGMNVMGSQLNNRVVGIVGLSGPYDWPTRLVQIDVPQLSQSPFGDPVAYDRVSPAVAFPILGVPVQGLQAQDSVFVIQLGSTFPNGQQFQRRLNGGTWGSVAPVDVLPVGQCRVEYRSLDPVGNVSASTVLDVWLPRGPAFIASALPGSPRAQARYCI